ncbi:CGNR zinc finger domain-containing protein [Agromyces sp. NPDC049794]|uniref:CGNR zinc finger domain-containing protein n=1 Tax=unclassified Agromyces TaxID=2639701 RepID=UPI0033F15314
MFEHVANARCLELTNSVPDRHDDRDWLADGRTAGDWAASLGFELARPLTQAERAALIDLREAIFGVFAAHVDATSVDQRALREVTRQHAQGLERHGYTAEAEGFRRDWPDRWDGPALRAAFASSAVELMTDPRLDRVKQCPGCGWLFVDTSKNRSRRWCSMEMCGGRDKALRHYRKQRAETRT